MKHIHPDYYDKFHCIAGNCSITCCKEWKIAVDDATNRKWKNLTPPDSIGGHRNNLSSFTCKKDGSHIIRLSSGHLCPFLSDDKLCRLVIEYGDSVLSKTCTIFPREIHEYETHTEESLMPCCPAVIDLWKNSPVFFPDAISAVPLFEIRKHLIDLIMDTGISPELALLEGFYILLELYRHKDGIPGLTKDYFSAKTLEELASAIRDIHIPQNDTINECNELLQDLAVNYQKEGLYTEFLKPVLGQVPDKSWNDFTADAVCYDMLFRNFLANEIYSDSIDVESSSAGIKHMVTQYQWIIIEYTAIRQCLFHIWSNSDCKMTYEDVRNYIVIISRMTGYDDDDINTYLKNSFENLIWEWGYAALIVGR